MIITCDQCLKKFEIESNLIPKSGRLLQCSSCGHKWFYKRDVSESIMKSMDLINSRYGNSTLKIASEGVENKWKIKREKLTPSYTTNFKDIIRVKC